jgi:spore coat protein U-like protein
MKRRDLMRQSFWFLRMTVLSCLALLTQNSRAANCSFRTVNAVSFGIYNVYATTPNNNGVGSLSIRCQNGAGSFVVSLSKGQGNSYTPRVMKSGTNLLNYNLYTTTARTTIWGDGSSGTATRVATGNATTTLSVFGQIPAGQDAAVGAYVDTIIATVNF